MIIIVKICQSKQDIYIVFPQYVGMSPQSPRLFISNLPISYFATFMISS